MQRALTTCLLIALLAWPVQGATEDFTTWTPVQYNDELTILAAGITVDPIDASRVVYTYKDFGAEYFEDVTVYFTWNGGADSANDNTTWAGVFAFADDIGAWNELWYESTAVCYWNRSNDDYRLLLRIGSYSSPAWGACEGLSVDTDYYVTFQKEYSGGDNSTGQYTLTVRTGSHSGAVVDTVVVASPAAHHDKFRYAYAILSRYQAKPVGYNSTSGTIGTLDIGAPSEDPPDKVTNPTPLDDATGVAASAAVSWSPASGADDYDVYFGLAAGAIGDQFQETIEGTSWDPDGLMADSTEYQWRIDASNVNGATTGDVWSFTTEAAPSGAPTKAANPDPPHESTAGVNADLDWGASAGATDYNVYFGLASGAIGDQLVGNTVASAWPLDTLEYATEYHWRIDANNLTYSETTGDVWTFTTASAGPAEPLNHFEVDPNAVMLLRFESAASVPMNGASTLDGVNTGVAVSTSSKKEFGASGVFDGSDVITFVDANQPDSMFDGDEFSICGWFKLDAVGNKDLIRKGTVSTNLSVALSVYDAGDTESFRLSLGKDSDSGLTADTYTHATDLSAGDWWFCGVSVDPNANVLMRVYRDGYGKQGADVDTAVLTDYEVNTQDFVLGTSFAGGMDQVAIFDDALTFADMDAIYAAEYLYYANRPFTYYCAVDGNNARLGTAALPWGPLSKVCTGDAKGVQGIMNGRAKAGDTIRLGAGYHGSFDLHDRPTYEKVFSDYLTIGPAAGVAAQISTMWLNGAQHIKFDGTGGTDQVLTITPSAGGALVRHAPDNPWPIVYASNGSNSHYLYFKKCMFYPIADANSWDATDWAQYAYAAIRLPGADDVTVDSCYMLNCCEGVGLAKNRCKVTNTTIKKFTENGIFVGSGTDQEFSYNTIIDSMYFSHSADVWNNTAEIWHTDCIQIGYAGTSTNLKVHHNYINGAVDSTRADKGSPQGIFLACGLVNAEVYNNVVIVYNAANAMSFSYGPPISSPIAGLWVAHNTVLPIDGFGGDTIIRFQGDNGDPLLRNDIVVVNNIAHDVWADTETAMWTWLGNVDAGTLNLYGEFVDYSNGNVHLKPTATLIDAGTTAYDTPDDDLDEVARDDDPDVGAYEYDSGSPPSEYPPARAVNPFPADAETDVAVSTLFSWSHVPDADDYLVYLAPLGTTPALVESSADTLYYPPYGLQYDTVYRWRVDPNNAYGTTTGLLWSFRTEAADLPQLPGPPSNPQPADGSLDRSINPVLYWQAGSGATSHRVYFGTTTPPPLRGTASGTSMAVGPLAYNTTCYWFVEAINADGTTPSAVWSFTTIESGGQEPPDEPVEPDLPSMVYSGVHVRSTRPRTARRDAATGRYGISYDVLNVFDLVLDDVSPRSYAIDPNMSGYLERIEIVADGTDTQWQFTVADSWGVTLFDSNDLDMTAGPVSFFGWPLPFHGGLLVTVADTPTDSDDVIRARLFIKEEWRR